MPACDSEGLLSLLVPTSLNLNHITSWVRPMMSGKLKKQKQKKEFFHFLYFQQDPGLICSWVSMFLLPFAFLAGVEGQSFRVPDSPMSSVVPTWPKVSCALGLNLGITVVPTFWSLWLRQMQQNIFIKMIYVFQVMFSNYMIFWIQNINPYYHLSLLEILTIYFVQVIILFLW